MSHAALERFCDALPGAFADGDPHHAAKGLEASNVKHLMALYRAAVAGDVAAIQAILADDVEMEIHAAPEVPWTGRWQGRDNVLAAMGRNLSTIQTNHLEVQSLIAQGDTVVVVTQEQGVYLPTGRPYDMHWVQMFTFHNGRLRRFREFLDSAAILPALQP